MAQCVKGRRLNVGPRRSPLNLCDGWWQAGVAAAAVGWWVRRQRRQRRRERVAGQQAARRSGGATAAATPLPATCPPAQLHAALCVPRTATLPGPAAAWHQQPAGGAWSGGGGAPAMLLPPLGGSQVRPVLLRPLLPHRSSGSRWLIAGARASGGLVRLAASIVAGTGCWGAEGPSKCGFGSPAASAPRAAPGTRRPQGWAARRAPSFRRRPHRVQVRCGGERHSVGLHEPCRPPIGAPSGPPACPNDPFPPALQSPLRLVSQDVHGSQEDCEGGRGGAQRAGGAGGPGAHIAPPELPRRAGEQAAPGLRRPLPAASGARRGWPAQRQLGQACRTAGSAMAAGRLAGRLPAAAAGGGACGRRREGCSLEPAAGSGRSCGRREAAHGCRPISRTPAALGMRAMYRSGGDAAAQGAVRRLLPQ